MKSHIADPATRIYAIRIEAINGLIARFVQYPHDISMTSTPEPVNYNAGSGYEFTSFSATSGTAPGLVDLRGVLMNAVGYLDRDEVASRVWDGAKAYMFATSWAAPEEDEEPLAKFFLGKAKIEDDRYVFELMSLIDAANQITGRTVGPLCTWTLFDRTLDGDVIPWSRSKCTGPRSAPDGPSMAFHTATGSITSASSRTLFYDAARLEVDDFFGAGSIRFTSGNNAGLLSEEIKSYSYGGAIEIYHPFHYPIEVGDEYEMIPGCRKRRAEDCIAKWSNGINHGAFDRVPVSSVYQSIGTGGV